MTGHYAAETGAPAEQPKDGSVLRVLHCDVLVVGSGAAGLAAAVTAAHYGLDVVVAEKEDVIGGTSAWSGGWLWIPRNPLARRAGIEEDIEGPLTYLRSEIGNHLADRRIDIFLEEGPKMVSFFEENSALQFVDGNRIPDFHETPGHLKGGRSVSAKPYDGRQLGPWIKKLRPPLGVVSLWGMGIASGADMAHFFNAVRKPRSMLHVMKRLIKHGRDLALHGRAMQLVNGNALVARLLKSALDKGVRILTEAPVLELTVAQERISGALIGEEAARARVLARCGVILATGGFPHDTHRISQMFDHARAGASHHSAAPRSNTGDGMRLAEKVGAEVAQDLTSPGAWAPVSLVPQPKGEPVHFPHLIERAKPGFIAVRKDGRRFVNEADSYHDFMKALFAATPEGEKPEAWLICDHRAQRRFGLGWAKPFPFPVSYYVRKGYLKRGRSLEELASACGIDAPALRQTVDIHNRDSREGLDTVFGKGSTAYNRVQGDPDNQPNPCLAPIAEGPFYAVRLLPGSLGTFAGLRTDEHGRVLTQAGQPIPGLFAAGNDMSSIMGGNYPSGGITLGPGMTFGYVIGRTLAEAKADPGNDTTIKERHHEIL